MAAVLQSYRLNEGSEGEEEELSLTDLFLALLRKPLAGCRYGRQRQASHRSMEIGRPTNVEHVTHVTFDRFHGFLGLPGEFEPQVPRRAPSASASVFGVSTESMQCSFDSRGNSVPTILLSMQQRLYDQGGLRAEGIFRINAENSQEESVRDQLNHGIVPDDIDVHCLASLIKAWFRELPTGILDSLEPEQVMQCESEEQCAQLVMLLPATEAALLDWTINLMADIVLEEHYNKMNARNIAVVFSPNMTRMVVPRTALIYAVQVMNFLRMLILKMLKEREELFLDASSVLCSGSSDKNGHRSPELHFQAFKEEDIEQTFVHDELAFHSPTHQIEDLSPKGDAPISFQTSPATLLANFRRKPKCQSKNHESKKGTRRDNGQSIWSAAPDEKSRGMSMVTRINYRVEIVEEVWR